MRILISGATGLVGTALAAQLRKQNHEVLRLVRPSSKDSKETDVPWDSSTGELGTGADGSDVVVHLAGASIAGGRWNAQRKAELRNSRIPATKKLVAALGKMQRPPSVLIAASAIGYYGDRGDEMLTESSAPGTDFLAELARDWEAESARARDFGARVAQMRFGIILAKHGGALPQIALPFKLGAGGRIGSGRQWMSWITLEDVVSAICYAIAAKDWSGPANIVAPNPARNSEFAAALGRVLHRTALLPTPGFALRIARGAMADALLLRSQRVRPARLEQAGFRFAHPDLVPALQAVLG